MKKKVLILTALAATALLITGYQHQVNASGKANVKSTSIKKKTKKPNKIDRIIKHMTLDEKIGQLYFAHSTGHTQQMKPDVKKYHLGGTTHQITKTKVKPNLIKKCVIIKKSAIMAY